MAIGLVPHYSVGFPVEGLTSTEFLVVIREAAKRLDWDVSRSDLNGLTAYTRFRRGSLNEKIELTVAEGLVTLKSESQGGQFFDMGRNKRNIEAFIACYDDLRSSLTPEELKSEVQGLSADRPSNPGDIVSGDENSLKADKNTKGIFSILIPVKGYLVTPILIDLNILVFLLMTVSGVNILLPDNESLLRWGANFRPLTLDGQPWRLITNCFLHIGLLHLAFNMYALLYIGILLEPRLGSRRFGVAYLVTGISASMASLYWHELTISAGASGAIFGMYGVFLAMLTTNLIEKSVRKALLTSIAIFVGYNLLNGLKGGIDNAAHIGGLISGIIIGYSFYPGLTNSQDKKLSVGLPAGILIALLGLSFLAYQKIPDDVVRYDQQMKLFSAKELLALRIYKMPASTPRDSLLSEIRDRDLNYWKENKNLMTGLDKLRLPPEIHERNAKLIQYCELRINSCELLYKAIDENTNAYDGQLRRYNHSIDSLIKSLK
jgi:rhomboid protease GluP